LLSSSHNYADPRQFNDPFDCSPQLEVNSHFSDLEKLARIFMDEDENFKIDSYFDHLKFNATANSRLRPLSSQMKIRRTLLLVLSFGSKADA